MFMRYSCNSYPPPKKKKISKIKCVGIVGMCQQFFFCKISKRESNMLVNISRHCIILIKKFKFSLFWSIYTEYFKLCNQRKKF